MDKEFEIMARGTRVNKDTLKLLCIHPLFQKIVSDVRGDFDIPRTGFADGESVKKWTDNLIEGSDRVMEDEEFSLAIRENTMRFRAGEVNHIEWRETNDRIHLTVPLNKWKSMIKSTASQFGLGENFHEAIEMHFCMAGLGISARITRYP